MENIKKNFGFGCMRLPMQDGEVDLAEFGKMVDTFMTNGFNYFDTAHGYVGKKSETSIRACLTKRYPRESYVLTNKLSTHFFEKNEEIRPLIEEQLEACGVDYFDYYLMHAQSADIYAKYKRCSAYETALEMMEEGKFKHFGISFHDTAEVLEIILSENPKIEVVQIQFNYADYDDPVVESRKCLEVCRKYDKPVIVMEPTKGGNLVNLPENAKAVLDALDGGSTASYAIRYAAGFEGVFMVLSGMSNMEQMEDNISYMSDFKFLNEEEQAAVDQVRKIFKDQNLIACTSCRYCVDDCPSNILIPDLFACMNQKELFHNWNTDYYYNNVYTINNGKASDCIQCGACEEICPQHLEIRDLLVNVASAFE